MALRRLLAVLSLFVFLVHADANAQEQDAAECFRLTDGDVPTNHLNRGICHMSRNLLPAAKGEFQYVIALNNEKETYLKHAAHLNLGVVYLMEENYPSAIKNFLSAIEIKPDYAEAHFNLGIVYYKQKLLNKAEESFRKAIELQPDYGRAHYSLGFIYLEQKKFDLARQHAEKAAENGVPFKTLLEKLAKVRR